MDDDRLLTLLPVYSSGIWISDPYYEEKSKKMESDIMGIVSENHETYCLSKEDSTINERRQIHTLFESHGYDLGDYTKNRNKAINGWDLNFYLNSNKRWFASTCIAKNWIRKKPSWWIEQILIKNSFKNPSIKYIDNSLISPKDTFLDEQLKTLKK